MPFLKENGMFFCFLFCSKSLNRLEMEEQNGKLL